MRPFQFELDLDEDITNMCGSLALMTSALCNELYPGVENHTKWCAAMRLMAVSIEKQVLMNEVGSPDDHLGFDDLEAMDDQENRLRMIVAR